VSALHTDELKIAAALSDAEPLQEELKDFQRKVSGRGEGDLQCRTGAHDDLVLPIAIRCGGRRQGL
jgi:TRAP-type C4-dicarboxylate transport system substrate-binding protein